MRVCAAQNYKESLASIIARRERLSALELEDASAVARVHSVLQSAREKEVVLPPHRVLEYILRESGFLEYVIAQDPEEGGRVVRRVYDEIESMVVQNAGSTLREVAGIFETLHAYRLSLNAPYIGGDARAVQVMTAHKSKGLEFEVVVIPHLVDSLWGGTVRRTYFDLPLTKHIETGALDAVDDERRLLYVAMTRAKGRLCLSSSEMNTEGRGCLPSRLFDRIESSLYSEESVEDVERAFSPLDVFKGEGAHTTLDSEKLRTLFLERGLSATALNNYLASPWTYVYRNLLRVPEVQTESLLFGTAVHSVLERVVKYVGEEGVVPSDSMLSAYLKQALERLPLSETEYSALHEKGFAALSLYVKELTLPKKSEVEFSVRALFKTGDPELPELLLTGKLDRLDFDEEGRVTRVVDYKTGKPKTRGYVEGTTKDSNGDYKRQLIFYALLLSLLDDERYHSSSYSLSFVEPSEKGEIVGYHYEITPAEVEELKGEIVRVAKEITHGAFLEAPCDPKVCDYCDLAEALMRR